MTDTDQKMIKRLARFCGWKLVGYKVCDKYGRERHVWWKGEGDDERRVWAEDLPNYFTDGNATDELINAIRNKGFTMLCGMSPREENDCWVKIEDGGWDNELPTAKADDPEFKRAVALAANAAIRAMEKTPEETT